MNDNKRHVRVRVKALKTHRVRLRVVKPVKQQLSIRIVLTGDALPDVCRGMRRIGVQLKHGTD